MNFMFASLRRKHTCEGPRSLEVLQLNQNAKDLETARNITIDVHKVFASC